MAGTRGSVHDLGLSALMSSLEARTEAPCGSEIRLIRSTESEKGRQIANVSGYQALRNTPEDLAYLQKTARDRANVFAAVMEAVKSYSLGWISHALYDAGGECRGDM